MIKQFNFYDIYGYLIPGTVLLGILWLPIGVLTNSWPDKDLSKALFLAALAYILGLLVQSVASPLVSSKIKFNEQMRAPSDLLLDASSSKNDPNSSNNQFSPEFKERLGDQIERVFGLEVKANQDGKAAEAIKARDIAFFQARTVLLVKKVANYVEQYEGMYVMMRGVGCSLCAGAAYLAGWASGFHRDLCFVWVPLSVLGLIAIGLTFLSVWRSWPKPVSTAMRVLWLAVFMGLGFSASFSQTLDVLRHSTTHPEFILWGSVVIALIAAAKCFSAYRSFSNQFAASVWRDFSARISYAEITKDKSGSTGEDSSGED